MYRIQSCIGSLLIFGLGILLVTCHYRSFELYLGVGAVAASCINIGRIIFQRTSTRHLCDLPKSRYYVARWWFGYDADDNITNLLQLHRANGQRYYVSLFGLPANTVQNAVVGTWVALDYGEGCSVPVLYAAARPVTNRVIPHH